MKLYWLIGVAAAITVTAGQQAFAANTWNVNCTTGQIRENGGGAIVTGLTGSTTLGTVLGTPSAPASGAAVAQAGGTVEITGICTHDVEVRTSGLLITDDNESSSPASTDAIEGQLSINSAQRVTIAFLALGWTSTGNTLAAGDAANVDIFGDASVLIENCSITDGPLDGLLVTSASSVRILSSTISGNGTSGAARDDDGIRVSGSTLTLGGTNSDGVTVSGNTGVGVDIIEGSTLDAFDATIEGSGEYQLFVFASANAYVTSPSVICAGTYASSTCTPAASGGPAIGVLGSSNVQIDALGSGSPVIVTGPNNKQALLVGSASSAVIEGSVFAGAGSSNPVVEATSASAIDSTGGNTICAGTWTSSCSATSGGGAVEVDHIANMLQINASALGYTTQAEDFITGGGLVEDQSNFDFGQGASSLSWTVGSANILVQQNSSFRLSGGVTITGDLVFQQGSNGFFNTADGGGANAISSVSCNFATVAASHVAGGGTAVSPAVATTVTPATGSNECMPF